MSAQFPNGLPVRTRIAPRDGHTASLLSAGRTRRYDPGQYIIIEGEHAASLFMILEGSVSVLVEGEEGEETVLAHNFPGDIFGELCLCSEDQGRSACVVAREPCEIIEISYRHFLNAAAHSPELWLRIVRQLSGQLRQATNRVRMLAQCSVTQRIANLLRDLAAQPMAVQDDGETVIKMTRQELASMAGCSREVASRSLQELARTGLIALDGRSIRVTALLE